MRSVASSSAESARRRPRRFHMAGILVLPLVLAGCAAGPAPAAPVVERGLVAQRVLQELVLPPGAGVLAAGATVPTSFQSDELGCAGMVQREQYWHVPSQSIDAAQAWFESHASSALRLAGTGSGGGRGGETMTEVDYAVRAGQSVGSGSRLVVEAVAAGDGSVVRASAQVVPASGCGSAARFAGLHR